MSRNSSGVAKRSYHMQGKAIDLRIPDVPLKKHLRKAALELGRGGVDGTIPGRISFMWIPARSGPGKQRCCLSIS